MTLIDPIVNSSSLEAFNSVGFDSIRSLRLPADACTPSPLLPLLPSSSSFTSIRINRRRLPRRRHQRPLRMLPHHRLWTPYPQIPRRSSMCMISTCACTIVSAPPHQRFRIYRLSGQLLVSSAFLTSSLLSGQRLLFPPPLSLSISHLRASRCFQTGIAPDACFHAIQISTSSERLIHSLLRATPDASEDCCGLYRSQRSRKSGRTGRH